MRQARSWGTLAICWWFAGTFPSALSGRRADRKRSFRRWGRQVTTSPRRKCGPRAEGLQGLCCCKSTEVAWGSGYRHCFFAGIQLPCKSVVRDLDVSICIKEYVLWFEVAIYEAHIVKILKRKEDLPSIKTRSLLPKRFLLLNLAEHLSSPVKMHHQEHFFLGLEGIL